MQFEGRSASSMTENGYKLHSMTERYTKAML